jgi:hypothetical protein
MNYLERYLNGEYEQVWTELQNLGATVRQEPHYNLAVRVADETMRRVRSNCERIIDYLRTINYEFGVYPDGSPGYFSAGPLVPPADGSGEDQKALEEAVGPLPIMLVAFWQQVGSIDFVGRHPEWLKGLDPLVIYAPEVAVSDLDAMDEMKESIGHFEATLSPDDLHKDNVSGDAPYAVRLPDPNMDFVFQNEKHNLYFVPYLRFALLRFGGFPGIEGGEAEFQYLASLVKDLEPF